MSDQIAQTITLPAITPATPLVLCNAGFLTTLAQVERDVAHIAVSDASTAQAAANLLTRLTAAGTALEKARADLKAPFIAKGREIDEAARAPTNRIEAAKTGIKRKVAEFQAAQEKAAREAEIARQAELRRLEGIRLEEERLANEKAAKLAKEAADNAAKAAALGKPLPEVVEFESGDEAPKTETELAIERVKFAPAPVAAKPAGIAYKTFLIIESVDVAKLPDLFVIRTANEKALRATYCTGWKDGDALPECPGVAFKIDKTVSSTGRAMF